MEESTTIDGFRNALITGERGVSYQDGAFTWVTGALNGRPYISLLQYQFAGDARPEIMSAFSQIGIDLRLSSFVNINNQGGAGYNTIIFDDLSGVDAADLEDVLTKVTNTVTEA